MSIKQLEEITKNLSKTPISKEIHDLKERVSYLEQYKVLTDELLLVVVDALKIKVKPELKEFLQ